MGTTSIENNEPKETSKGKKFKNSFKITKLIKKEQNFCVSPQVHFEFIGLNDNNACVIEKTRDISNIKKIYVSKTEINNESVNDNNKDRLNLFSQYVCFKIHKAFKNNKNSKITKCYSCGNNTQSQSICEESSDSSQNSEPNILLKNLLTRYLHNNDIINKILLMLISKILHRRIIKDVMSKLNSLAILKIFNCEINKVLFSQINLNQEIKLTKRKRERIQDEK